MQRYTMVLWRNPEDKNMSFKEIAELAYNTITIFNEMPEKYRPNYQTVKSKKEAQLFNWDFDFFCDNLKKHINHTQDDVFEELGYRISFFSSLKNEDSCGYSLGVGMKNKLLCNCLVVKFPYNMDYFSDEISSLIENLFYKAVKTFEPYFGCLSNNSIFDINKGYLNNDNKVIQLHWLNYWSPEIIKSVDEKKLKQLEKKYKEFVFKDGFVKLQNIALNANNTNDINYKNKVEDYLLK